MLVKKCTSLFLAILLLISNFGLAFSVHYCGNKIASISTSLSTIKTADIQNECCCIEEVTEKKSCCKDKVIDLKKNTKEVVVKSFSFQIDAPFVLLKSSQFLFAKAEKVIANLNVTHYYCSPNAPPLFKLFQQYIFYA